MTINDLINELCAIRDLSPGNGDLTVCTEQEVQLGELYKPMTDLTVDITWLDKGMIKYNLGDCSPSPVRVCYLHEAETEGDFM